MAAGGPGASRRCATPPGSSTCVQIAEDGARRRARLVGGHRPAAPRAAVPRALGCRPGGALDGLPHRLARHPAGGRHLPRGLPGLPVRDAARRRRLESGTRGPGRLPARQGPVAARRGGHHRHDRARGAGHRLDGRDPAAPAGCWTPASASSWDSRSTCWCGHRCATAPPGRRPTRSRTTSRGCCARWPTGSVPTWRPADVDQWVRGCREVDLRIDRAWQLRPQARESGRLNPRRSRDPPA